VGHTLRAIARTRPDELTLELTDGFAFELGADPDESELRQWRLDLPESWQVEAGAYGELRLLSRCDTLEPRHEASFSGPFKLRR
jgi:hypothetical protein